ncbi:MAG: hypothetical protein R2854_31595 [Caldilineaceae bacterium]
MKRQEAPNESSICEPTVDRRTLLRTAAAISQALRRSPGLRAPLTVPDGALSWVRAPAIAPRKNRAQ